MYENIYLLNRVKLNGELKKNNYSFFNKSLRFILFSLLIFLFLLYVIVYISVVGFNLTIDLFFESLLNNLFLKIDICFIGILFWFIYILKDKKKNLVSFKIDLENDILTIIFTEGKLQGIEYKMFLSDISNVCMYKNNIFSFYCNEIKLLKNNTEKKIKGTFIFSMGESGLFISDLQNYLNFSIRYVNKNN